MNKKDKEAYRKMYDEVMKDIESTEIPQKEMEGIGEWFDDLQRDFMKTLSSAVKRFPDENGFMEATMTAVGRFVCTLMERIQHSGFLNEGVDIYENFVNVVLPVCHNVAIKEYEEDKELLSMAKEFGISESEMLAAKYIAEALSGTMTEEEIFDRYIESDDREGFLETLREMRAKIREMQTSNS